MSLFDATIAPPQSYEAVVAARDILAGDVTIVVKHYLAEGAHVFAHFATEEKPDRYLVVRELQIVGSRMQTITKHLVVSFQVMAVIDKNLPNVHKWLGAIHKRVFASIVNQKPSLTLGKMTLPINREGVPSAAALDDDTNEWYSTAEFFATIEPA